MSNLKNELQSIASSNQVRKVEPQFDWNVFEKELVLDMKIAANKGHRYLVRESGWFRYKKLFLVLFSVKTNTFDIQEKLNNFAAPYKKFAEKHSIDIKIEKEGWSDTSQYYSGYDQDVKAKITLSW